MSPGWVQRSAAARMRRLSAVEKVLRRAWGTTSESAGGRDAGRAEPGAPSVALRASCDAPGTVEYLTECIGTLGCWLFVIGTSLLTDFSEGDAAGHIGTGGAVAFSLALQRGPRIAGVALALLGVPIAWARIYLGVHFPFDMLGAGAVAAICAWLTLREARWYLVPSYQLATGIHRRLFGGLIALGWVRE